MNRQSLCLSKCHKSHSQASALKTCCLRARKALEASTNGGVSGEGEQNWPHLGVFPNLKTYSQPMDSFRKKNHGIQKFMGVSTLIWYHVHLHFSHTLALIDRIKKGTGRTMCGCRTCSFFRNKNVSNYNLVGGFNPFEKN